MKEIRPVRIRLSPAWPAVLLFLTLILAPDALLAAPRPYAEWTALVVAGDWRASGGKPTTAFDNARADVSAALVARGFSTANILQYSLRPSKPGEAAGATAKARDVVASFIQQTGRANGGCLFYLTSHGDKAGAAFGPDLVLSPAMLDRLLDEACPARPVVAVISACYSGVFVKPLAGDDRLVLTAARADRSSFGCGVEDRYPWFDACVLETFPSATDFADLGRRARACVATREKAARARPASEPQLSVGVEFQLLTPAFAPTPP